MKETIIRFLDQVGIRTSYVKRKMKQYDYHKIQLREWENAGKPVPPPHIVKQQVIIEFQKKYQCETLVETGTYLGEMIDAQLNNFNRIYSIELGEDLWKAAVKKFEKYPYIDILQGDSGTVLKSIVPKLNTPAIFWLDGHYSEGVTAKGEKECPIYEELQAIFTSKINHVLLIDDARCFNGIGDYPSIKDLSAFVLSNRPDSKIEVKDDVIRVECR